MTNAPIVLFVYNRPDHTRKTLEALSENELANVSDLFVYADGARAGALQVEIEDIAQVLKIVKSKAWCKNVTLKVSENNKGLAKSIINGVTEIINKYGKIIVLEDDLVTSPNFLKYMNTCLDLYENVENIYSINSYMFPIDTKKAETVILPYTSTWGWGTWKKRWEIFDFEMNGKEFITSNPYLSERLNIADYSFIPLLNGNNSSWGIRWYFNVFQRNGLGVFPTKSLVHNIGFDGSGTHYTGKVDSRQTLTDRNIEIKVDNKIDFDFFGKYLIYFRKAKKSVAFKVVNKLKRFNGK